MQKELAKPANWQDFEHLVREFYQAQYLKASSNLYGGRNERQNGVDIYFPNVITLGQQSVAIQCKRYDVGKLTKTIINAEHREVQSFPGKVDTFIIVTTDKTSSELQIHAANKKNPTCEIVFWDSLERDIPLHENLLQKHYKEFVVYRDIVEAGNTASKYFILDFSGTRNEFLISRIPDHDGTFGNTAFLLNLQTKKATYYPVLNKFDLLEVFNTTHDAFAVYYFLQQFDDFAFFKDKSIAQPLLLHKETYDKLIQEVEDYKKSK
ncbi:hypothetical protein COK92_08460 [Bacillus anthracis]|nr:hypothetical protein COK92_08460 [Bacillus anthracis]